MQILIVEDNASDAELMKRELGKAGFDFTSQWVQDKQAFLTALDTFPPDLVLADYSVPGFEGLIALALARQRWTDIPVIIVSGAIGEELAIETLKAGATDYVLKDRLSRLGPVVRRAIQEAEEVAQRKQAEAASRHANEQLREHAARLQNQAEELQTQAEESTTANLALQAARDELEVRVQERTAELQKAKELVEAERQRFQDVLDQLPAYLVLLSPDYRVPFANRFFEERFGKSEGRRCYEYLFNRTEPCENCETYKVLKTNTPHHWEWTGPDGRNYDIHDFPFTDVDGSPLIMEVGLDITDRKQAEAELAKHREHLEELVQERTGQLQRPTRSCGRARRSTGTSWRPRRKGSRWPMPMLGLSSPMTAGRKSSATGWKKPGP